MHFTEEHLANAKKANLNVVIAGHISSDVLGLNLLLDEVEKDGEARIRLRRRLRAHPPINAPSQVNQ